MNGAALRAPSTRVLRLEDQHGSGPFCEPYWPEISFYLPYWNAAPVFWWEYGPDDAHPHHLEDVLVRNFGAERAAMEGDALLGEGNWRSGVNDEQQLLHWFPPETHAFLTHHGFTVAVYDVPEERLWMGGYQNVFDLDQAQLVRRALLAGAHEQ